MMSLSNALLAEFDYCDIVIVILIGSCIAAADREFYDVVAGRWSRYREQDGNQRDVAVDIDPFLTGADPVSIEINIHDQQASGIAG